MPELGEGAPGGAGREVARVRGEAEPGGIICPRPGYRRLIFDIVAGELIAVAAVGDADPPRHRAAPDDVEGDGGGVEGRLPLGPEGSGNLAVIVHGQVADLKFSAPGPEVYLHGAVGNGHGPEGPGAEAVAAHGTDGRTKAGVEIMGLGRVRRSEVKLDLVDVQSDFRERAIVDVAVHPLVDAIHEA